MNNALSNVYDTVWHYSFHIRHWFERRLTWRYTSRAEYETGLLCSRCGLMTRDMTRRELITFIGMLDMAHTAQCYRVTDLKAEMVKLRSHNEQHND